MRIISLLPAASEIVAALGAAEELVGVTHACDYPESVAVLPRVTRSAIDAAEPAGAVDRAVREMDAGGEPLFRLDEGAVEALAPDLIITQGICDVCAVAEGDVRELAARLSPAPRVLSLSAATLDEVLDDVQRVGEAIGRGSAAAALVSEGHARMRRVHDALAAAAAPRPRVAVLEWTDPLFAAGHWVPRMVRRAGGVDVLATEGERSRMVSLADVAAARPEVVLVAPCGYDAARAAAAGRALLEEAGASWPPGARAWAIDADALLSRPGPRLVDGVELLARILHPGVFGAPPPGGAAVALPG